MTMFDEIAELMDPLDMWDKQCHAASLRIVQSGIIPASCRVARGWHPHVRGQHSWVVIGANVYDPSAIIDATLWSYDDRVTNIVYEQGIAKMNWRPHGAGLIWDTGKPPPPREAPVMLTPTRPLSHAAQHFIDYVLGPLDRRGWSHLVHGGMEGWPSSEIVEAILDTPGLAAVVPIDIQGMVTNRNPDGIYLPGGEDRATYAIEHEGRLR